MNAKQLIYYAIKYSGDYNKLIMAIKKEEQFESRAVSNAITILDENYPKVLLELKNPPLVLFYKGDIELLNKKCISVVGSRNACDYALKATKQLVKRYEDLVVVSGMAKGIDTCAHENAKYTIGVLGCGIEYIYPYSNYELYKKISKNGLLISEYPFDTKPLAYHFPFRNRIIAALASRVYIMQSTLLSGTMTTVNQALELGKEIRVLPYDLYNECGKQNNTLINEGALMIENDEIAFL